MAYDNRKYDYDFDIEGFFNSYLPELKPEVQKPEKPNLRVVKPREKSQAELDAENAENSANNEKARRFNRRLFAVIGIPVAIITVFVMMNIWAYSVISKYDRQIAAVQSECTVLMGQNSLAVIEQNNLISAEEIERVAVEKLGLVKADKNNITYVNTADNNRVLVSSGRLVD